MFSKTRSAISDLTIACVLRSGGDFDAEYVERLRDGVAANLSLPHRFVCLSDIEVPCERVALRHGWPGWWSKLELFEQLKGRVLYFDLDTVIAGSLNRPRLERPSKPYSRPPRDWRTSSLHLTPPSLIDKSRM